MHLEDGQRACTYHIRVLPYQGAFKRAINRMGALGCSHERADGLERVCGEDAAEAQAILEQGLARLHESVPRREQHHTVRLNAGAQGVRLGRGSVCVAEGGKRASGREGATVRCFSSSLVLRLPPGLPSTSPRKNLCMLCEPS